MIGRDVPAAAAREFDLLVVGGGIYGASLLYEATRRGMSACLCEARDFGGGTTQNSLRILHGGLRYLQTLDLRRFIQSVAARRMMARRFPALVRPLPCLMPLYGPGLKRPAVLRAALGLNDLLSAGRNRGLPAAVRLPGGTVLDTAATRQAFPLVRENGLLGAACWSDYFMVSSERILIELLRNACARGAVALNYVRVDQLIATQGQVAGAVVTDVLTGATPSLRARCVVDCSGPQVRRLASDAGDREAQALFRPSLAFNVLLEAALPSESAVAVAAPEPRAPMLFLVPQRRTVLAGTMHLPRPAGTLAAEPTSEELDTFLGLLRAAVPGLDARRERVRRVFAGLLPARAVGTADLVKRERLVDQGAAGGLRGFHSVAGVKFTTAGDVAHQVMTMLGAGRKRASAEDEALPTAAATALLIDAGRLCSDAPAAVREALHGVVHEESVQSLDDLILRRTNWATTEPNLEAVRARLDELGVRFAAKTSADD